VATVSGQLFPHSLRFVFPVSSTSQTLTSTYALSGGFKAFQATLGMEQGAAYAAKYEVFVDNRRILEQTVGTGDKVQSVELDVRGANLLRLVMTTVSPATAGSGYSATAIWGDALAIGLDTP
jgi:hypothetical protein